MPSKRSDQPSLASLRHLAAQILALAVNELFPAVALVKGEASALGFFYEFKDPHTSLSIEALEEKMRSLILEGRPIHTLEMTHQNSIDFFLHHNNRSLAQRIEHETNPLISLIKIGDFYNLSPQLPFKSTRELIAYKFLSIERKEHTTRIEGTAFYTQRELKNFLKNFEQAKKRAHSLLGEQLKLYFKEEESYYWLPKGTQLQDTLIHWWKREHQQRGFQLIQTPRHPPSNNKAQIPHNLLSHALAYRAYPSSDLDLPLRFSEIAPIHHTPCESTDLFSTPTYHSDQSTIFCTPSQVAREYTHSLEMIHHTLTLFQLDYKKILVTKKGQGKEWSHHEKLLTQLATPCITEYSSTLHGPQIKFKIKDAIGREWTGPYVGVHLRHSEQLNLPKRPQLLIHSTIGSIERFIALLIEHTSGVLPLWLAPEQIRLIPIDEKKPTYTKEILERIQEVGLRVSGDFRKEKLSGKISLSQCEKIPYTVVLGIEEEKTQTLTVRPWGQKEIKNVQVTDFLQSVLQDMKSLTMEYRTTIEN